MTEPLVSVLMTSYNREKFIAEAIESVLKQTYKNFELIIVDDCSKDHTVEIARRYAPDPRVQIHVNVKNLRQFPNRNHAAELAKGKYLKYVDSDDLIYPHCLDVMVRSMETYPEAGLGLCSSKSLLRPCPALHSPADAYREHFLRGNFIFGVAPTSAIILASAFRDVGGFTGMEHIGDNDLWLILAARYPVVQMVPGLSFWRTHGNQALTVMLDSPDVIAMTYRRERDALLSPQCPLPPEDKQKALHRHKRSYVRRIIRYGVKGKPGFAWKIWRAGEFKPSDLKYAFRRVS